MKLTHYGITFRRIQRADIEKLRQWRNLDTIRQKMVYRQHNTKTMQREWFKSIENSYHFSYYIIHYNNTDIGIIHQKNFNLPGKMKESGIFIVDEKYKNGHIPIISSLTMIDIAFYAMLQKNLTIRVLKNNQEALNYNYDLGYKIDKEEKDYFILQLTVKDYITKTKKLRAAINKLYGISNIELFLEPIDFNLGYAPYFIDIIHKIPKKHILEITETVNSLKLVMNIDSN